MMAGKSYVSGSQSFTRSYVIQETRAQFRYHALR